MIIGVTILAIVVGFALLAGVLYHDPLDMVAQPLIAPGADGAYPLGTDVLGRDMVSELAHGARTTLIIALVSTAFAILVGCIAGVLSGYYRGWVDDIFSKITELFQTVPSIILVIALVVVLGPSIRSTTIAIGLASWPAIARLARGEVLALRDREFILACFAVGMSDVRIIVRHVLPNIAAPIMVMLSIVVATSILIESGLAFLGLGDPNVVSWGSMIGEGRDLLRTEWQLTLIPGLAITLTVLGLNFVAEVLSEKFSPRLLAR
jgi:peptide/nickel transport system permease protein